MKEFIKTYGWAVILVLIVSAFLSWWLTINVVDNECYEKIANSVCPENEIAEEVGARSFLNMNNYDYKCCKIGDNITHRKLYDNYKSCDKYIYLDEDNRQCSKQYRHWKRVY